MKWLPWSKCPYFGGMLFPSSLDPDYTLFKRGYCFEDLVPMTSPPSHPQKCSMHCMQDRIINAAFNVQRRANYYDNNYYSGDCEYSSGKHKSTFVLILF